MKRLIALCTILTALCGCGSDDADRETSNNAGANTSTSAVARSAEKTSEEKTSLSEAPIDLDAALGRVPVTVTETAPCPFVSDEVAKAAARTRFALERREVSNTQCRWSYNAGFAIAITVEPIDSATPAAERRYNIGVDTELAPQTGPGKNAVLVADTAFGKPVPFGFGFELGSDAVFIRVTGMQTDVERLRATADAIARQLPNAPSIEPQRRSESVAFEPCSVWQAQAVKNALGLAESQSLAAQPSGNSCNYKAYRDGDNPGITLTLRMSELDASYHAKAIARGHDDVAGFDFPVSASIEESSFGTYTKLTGYVGGGAIEIFLLDEGNAKHTALSEQLLRNIASRI